MPCAQGHIEPGQWSDSGCSLLSLDTVGGVAQLVERLTGSQEVRGFKSHRLHAVVTMTTLSLVVGPCWLPFSHQGKRQWFEPSRGSSADVDVDRDLTRPQRIEAPACTHAPDRHFHARPGCDRECPLGMPAEAWRSAGGVYASVGANTGRLILGQPSVASSAGRLAGRLPLPPLTCHSGKRYLTR